MNSEEKTERRRINPTALISTGCKNHSIDDVRRGLRLAEETSPNRYAAALRHAVSASLLNEAADLVLYLITEENAPLNIEPSKLAICRSLPLWSAMIERGWDINQRASHGRLGQKKRLLDFICDDESLVLWCLGHGANIDDDHEDALLYPPLLESVAEWGTVSTFKLLRERGAVIGRRTLHLAVEKAVANKNERAMDMVRYLVDEVGLDVNQLDADTTVPLHPGPPLLYAANQPAQGDRVVRFLLERGADPYITPVWDDRDAFGLAQFRNNQDVLSVLQEWKEGKIPTPSRS